MLKFTTTNVMRESEIEAYGVKEFKKINIRLDKYTTPQRRSVPDRIALCDKGFTFFIEFKRPGNKPTDSQKREHNRLRDRGYIVLVIDSKTGVDEAVNLYKQGRIHEFSKNL